MSEPEVLFEVRGALAIATLNRPRALNALNLPMAEALYGQLDTWAADPGVDAVLVRGAGDRSFCAGGDVRAIQQADDRVAFGSAFFTAEYRLNRAIFRFPKPYVALMNGFVFGGGAGLSVHGSHRVVTDDSQFAMPETVIGLFADVGASHFFSAMPTATARYLAITGTRIGAADCLALDLATHYRAAGVFGDLVEELVAAGPLDAAKISDIIGGGRPASAGDLTGDQGQIDRCFGGDSVAGLLGAVAKETGPWAERVRDVLSAASPTSLELVWRELDRAAELADFEDHMRLEYRLAVFCLEHGDFYEGVRAALVDKDRQPKWRPDTLEAVDTAAIDGIMTADLPLLTFDQ